MVNAFPRGPSPTAKVGPFTAVLVNGVFGDPLLHLRIADHKRSILVDLGEGIRLSARTAHQVTDVFLSHAHIDHIAGFLSFLRSRIGKWPLCRVFGPPGIAANIAGLVAGVLWDRVAERAPRFEVTEFDGTHCRRFSVLAGRAGCVPVALSASPRGELINDDVMRVDAVLLDHKTPVLAFSFNTNITLKVRKERLLNMGLRPGPWLTRLKDAVARDSRDVGIVLPNGKEVSARVLANELLLELPGEKLVYATDFADTPENRHAVIALAAGAHTFFCEAPFRERDLDQAQRTGHLTTTACGEIASAAGVARLIPFHFSRRYEADPLALYTELQAACPATVVPDMGRVQSNENARRN
jgi:ribonuclease Z